MRDRGKAGAIGPKMNVSSKKALADGGARTYVLGEAMKQDDFQYAIENTRVLLAPDRRIDTFGSTRFRFYLVSELLDSVNVVRVRDGRIEAEKPRIVSPGRYSKLMLEGFGEKARGFADWLEANPQKIAFLKYGFEFRKMDVVEEVVRNPMSDRSPSSTSIPTWQDCPRLPPAVRYRRCFPSCW